MPVRLWPLEGFPSQSDSNLCSSLSLHSLACGSYDKALGSWEPTMGNELLQTWRGHTWMLLEAQMRSTSAPPATD